jgi:hypothetical protein
MPSFDYAAAKKAGLSDEQIQSYVAKRKAEGVDLQVPVLAPSHERKQSGLERAAGISNKFIGGLARFTGTDRAGESIARLGLQLGHQMGKVAGLDTNKTLPAPKFSGKQLIGDAAQIAGTGLNLAAPGATLGRRILANSGAAGLQGAGKELTSGRNAADAVSSGLVKGAVAGGITGGLGVLGKIAHHATSTVPEAIYKTSTQMRRQDRALPLIREGITGNRGQLMHKAKDMLRNAEDIKAADPRSADILDPKAALKYDPLKKYLGQQKLLGPVEHNAAMKVIAQKVNRGPMSRSKLDALRVALDEQSPPGVFTGKAHEVGSKTEGLVADAFRGVSRENAPIFSAQAERGQSAIALKNAIEDQMRSKQGVPGFIAGLIQRTLLTPAVGTRAARGLYRAGDPARRLEPNLIIKALKRAGRIGGNSALGGY